MPAEHDGMRDGFHLREAVNVEDFKRREALLLRLRRIRSDAEFSIKQIRYWNRRHPDATPFDTSFERALIAWCDGEGPMPTLPQGPTNG